MSTINAWSISQDHLTPTLSMCPPLNCSRINVHVPPPWQQQQQQQQREEEEDEPPQGQVPGTSASAPPTASTTTLLEVSDAQRRYILAIPSLLSLSSTPGGDGGGTQQHSPPPPPCQCSTPATSSTIAFEIARLDRQYTYYKSSCDGRILHPLLNPRGVASCTTTAQRIMDVGCGTGIWMADCATMHGGASSGATVVHGCDVDLSKVASELRPACIQHDVMDAFPLEGSGGPAQIGRQGSYDIVHARLLIYALGRGKGWKTAVQNMVRLLKPNGILHLSDLNAVAHLPPDADYQMEQRNDNAILRINAVAQHVMVYLNKDQYAGTNLESHLAGAGLEVSSTQKYQIPFGKTAHQRGFPTMQVEHGIRATMKAIEVLKVPYLASGGLAYAQGGVGRTSAAFDAWLRECERAIRERGMVYEFFMCYGRRIQG